MAFGRRSLPIRHFFPSAAIRMASIFSDIPGVDFEAAWGRRVEVSSTRRAVSGVFHSARLMRVKARGGKAQISGCEAIQKAAEARSGTLINNGSIGRVRGNCDHT